MANTRELGIIFGAVGLGLLLLNSNARAQGYAAPVVAGYLLNDDGSMQVDGNGYPIPVDAAGEVIPTDDTGAPVATAPAAPAAADQDAQLSALLATIRKFESRGKYDILYNFAPNTYGLSDHPSFLGWPGVLLPDSYCRGAGLQPGCKTTAAGAYQFLSATWRENQPPGSDFSPDAQDTAAATLLNKIGAVEALAAGDVDGAFRAASTKWASMPYSAAGQPKANLAQVMTAFENYGGVVA